jgi:hypothetical protein
MGNQLSSPFMVIIVSACDGDITAMARNQGRTSLADRSIPLKNDPIKNIKKK